MSNYRRANWSPLQPDPEYPKPEGVPIFTTATCQQLDQAIYLAWTYPWKDVDTITGFWIRVAVASQPDTVIRELFVADPDTDVIVSGLTNLVSYTAKASAQNPGGEGPVNSGITLMPVAPTIPTPTLKTLTAGDGEGICTWSWGTPLKDGLVWDWMSFEAVNEVGSTITEHITGGEWPNESGSLPLTNDHDWTCAIVAVARDTSTGKQYVSALSRSITIHPEKPTVPFRPRLTGAQMVSSNNGQIEASWVPGQVKPVSLGKSRWWRKRPQVRKDVGPLDVTAWQLRVIAADGGAPVFTYDILDPNVLSYVTSKMALGTWLVDVRAKNTVGWSDYSNQLAVTYKPTDSRPFIADQPYGSYEDAAYYYAMFDPGNDVRTGWENTWKLTITAAGAAVAFDFIAIGAGGGGKGQTVTLGKGGNGGGGYSLYGTIPAQAAGTTITVLVSKGGSTAIDPKDTRITAASPYVAPAGKSASSAADAAGAGRDRVKPEWWETTPFRWNQPLSTYVGGVAELGNQGYPDAIRWGEAGAGTKNSSAGKGYEGLVMLRWAK